jgi:hypothetical protein
MLTTRLLRISLIPAAIWFYSDACCWFAGSEFLENTFIAEVKMEILVCKEVV